MVAKTTTTTDARHYAVAGMTCEHCVISVREEVVNVAGVTSVAVDLVSGCLEVTGSDLDDQAIATAVAEAGYEVVA
jgi:copper chaperone CopZ